MFFSKLSGEYGICYHFRLLVITVIFRSKTILGTSFLTVYWKFQLPSRSIVTWYSIPYSILACPKLFLLRNLGIQTADSAYLPISEPKLLWGSVFYIRDRLYQIAMSLGHKAKLPGKIRLQSSVQLFVCQGYILGLLASEISLSPSASLFLSSISQIWIIYLCSWISFS
jgi:hypothetical protein